MKKLHQILHRALQKIKKLTKKQAPPRQESNPVKDITIYRGLEKNFFQRHCVKMSSPPYEKLLMAVITHPSAITQELLETFIKEHAPTKDLNFFLHTKILERYRGIDKNLNGFDCFTLGIRGIQFFECSYLTEQESKDLSNMVENHIYQQRFYNTVRRVF